MNLHIRALTLTGPHTFTHRHTHRLSHSHTLTHKHSHTHIHAFIHVYSDTHTFDHKHSHTHTLSLACTHTHTHSHSHALTHTSSTGAQAHASLNFPFFLFFLAAGQCHHMQGFFPFGRLGTHSSLLQNFLPTVSRAASVQVHDGLGQYRATASFSFSHRSPHCSFEAGSLLNLRLT